MSNVVVTLNSSGVRELLQSAEVADYLDGKADVIIGKCSGKYEKIKTVGKYRTRVKIQTTDKKTFFKNLNNNEILKALKGGN